MIDIEDPITKKGGLALTRFRSDNELGCEN